MGWFGRLVGSLVRGGLSSLGLSILEGPTVDSPLSLKPGGRLVLRGNNGTVRIEATDGPASVSYRKVAQAGSPEEARELMDTVSVDIAQTASGVDIRVSKPAPGLGIRRRTKVEFLIRMPRSCGADVQISNGDINLNGLGQAVTAETSNGAVTAEACVGDQRLSTHNGSVRAIRPDGGLELSTSNGSVEIADAVSNRVKATSSNGSINARVAPKAGPCEMTLGTSNGSVTLAVPAGIGLDVDCSTQNGSVTCPDDLNRCTRQRTRVQGTRGDARCRVRASAGNGSVTVRAL